MRTANVYNRIVKQWEEIDFYWDKNKIITIKIMIIMRYIFINCLLPGYFILDT